jgi:hypothetical protein
MRRSVLVSLVAAVAAYAPSPHCMRTQSTRSQPAHVVMKGKGSRGIPGKATSGRTASGGITDKAKKKFEIDDFNAKSEWTLVAEKDELGAETGSTTAVAAGVARKRVERPSQWCHRPPPGLLGLSLQARPRAYDQLGANSCAAQGPAGCCLASSTPRHSRRCCGVSTTQAPQGQEYVWTLIRGLPMKEGQDPQESSCYVTDGSCRTCLFPMPQANVEAVVDENGEPSHTISCGVCGTKWDLNSGKVLDFLPGNGPVQFAAKLANSKKEETPCTVLKTRISKAPLPTNLLYPHLLPSH